MSCAGVVPRERQCVCSAALWQSGHVERGRGCEEGRIAHLSTDSRWRGECLIQSLHGGRRERGRRRVALEARKWASPSGMGREASSAGHYLPIGLPSHVLRALTGVGTIGLPSHVVGALTRIVIPVPYSPCVTGGSSVISPTPSPSTNPETPPSLPLIPLSIPAILHPVSLAPTVVTDVPRNPAILLLLPSRSARTANLLQAFFVLLRPGHGRLEHLPNTFEIKTTKRYA